jgi:hypothetical protein
VFPENRAETAMTLLRILNDFAFVLTALPVPVAARSTGYVCGRSPAEIVSSNPTGGLYVCKCCVLLGRGLCDELITLPEESYRLWCVVVCVWSRNLVNEETLGHWGAVAPKPSKNWPLYLPIGVKLGLRDMPLVHLTKWCESRRREGRISPMVVNKITFTLEPWTPKNLAVQNDLVESAYRVLAYVAYKPVTLTLVMGRMHHNSSVISFLLWLCALFTVSVWYNKTYQSM